MTCCVGLVYEGTVFMGVDAASANDNWEMIARKDAKMFRTGGYLVSFTGSYRMGQLLQYELTLNPPFPGVDPFAYMVSVVIPAIRNTFKEGGFLARENEREEGGVFLVGFSGRLFFVHSDFQVGETITPYFAVGSGAQNALGALHAAYTLTPPANALQAKSILLTALSAAALWNAAVREPFLTEQV
jgi:hypothetical protein